MSRLVKSKGIEKGSYGIHPTWELRESTYEGGSTYVEAQSSKDGSWHVVARVAIFGMPTIWAKDRS